jgi:dCMP deaminase
MHRYTWDEYFMTMAYLVSMKSKDPSTRVGAVIVNVDNQIMSTGYNGFPRGIEDLEERYTNKEYKYLAINHAEENAILQCARNGISSLDCRLYVPWISCSRCAKSIIQSGINEVIYDANFPGNKQENQSDEWRQSVVISQEILMEAKVNVRIFNGNIIDIKGLYSGNIFDFIGKDFD